MQLNNVKIHVHFEVGFGLTKDERQVMPGNTWGSSSIRADTKYVNCSSTAHGWFQDIPRYRLYISLFMYCTAHVLRLHISRCPIFLEHTFETRSASLQIHTEKKIKAWAGGSFGSFGSSPGGQQLLVSTDDLSQEKSGLNDLLGSCWAVSPSDFSEGNTCWILCIYFCMKMG